jgi:hypothetical protein
MSHHYPPISPKAFAWALLSQAIWLPLVAIDAHDRWQARVRSLQAPAVAGVASASQRAQSNQSLKGTGQADVAAITDISTGLVLGSAGHGPNPYLDSPINHSIDLPERKTHESSAKPLRFDKLALLGRPAVQNAGINSRTKAVFSNGTEELDPIRGSFSRSELLGGILTLGDLNTSAMPPLAIAERARWASSGDPMAPLPEPWREPIRNAMKTLPNSSAKIAPARVVHVPSARVTKSTPVPLAIQDDGSVDILYKPVSPAVVEEIDSWSSRQKAPEPGSVAPTVVNLEPIPSAPAPVAQTSVRPTTEPVSWQREANGDSEQLPEVGSADRIQSP